MQTCIPFVRTTSVELTRNFLVLSIPEVDLENCFTIYLRICQPLPTIDNPEDVIVAIDNGGTQANTILTPCCVNNLYADQICSFRDYYFRYGSDTACWVYKGGWRLKRTRHEFDELSILRKKDKKEKLESKERLDKKSVKLSKPKTEVTENGNVEKV